MADADSFASTFEYFTMTILIVMNKQKMNLNVLRQCELDVNFIQCKMKLQKSPLKISGE